MTTKPMKAGNLRDRIVLQVPTITRDEMGAETLTWTALATISAAVWPISGREYFDARQTQAEITHRIRIRYRHDVNPTRRFVQGSRIFEIQSVINPEERGKMLDCMCIERVTP